MKIFLLILIIFVSSALSKLNNTQSFKEVLHFKNLLKILTNSTKNIIFVEFGFVSCLKFAIPTSKDSEALNIHNKNDNKIVLEFIYFFANPIICKNEIKKR